MSASTQSHSTAALAASNPFRATADPAPPLPPRRSPAPPADAPELALAQHMAPFAFVDGPGTEMPLGPAPAAAQDFPSMAPFAPAGAPQGWPPMNYAPQPYGQPFMPLGPPPQMMQMGPDPESAALAELESIYQAAKARMTAACSGMGMSSFAAQAQVQEGRAFQSQLDAFDARAGMIEASGRPAARLRGRIEQLRGEVGRAINSFLGIQGDNSYHAGLRSGIAADYGRSTSNIINSTYQYRQNVLDGTNRRFDNVIRYGDTHPWVCTRCGMTFDSHYGPHTCSGYAYY
ncbi:hypothetical protein DFJ74DRAFT_655589 [Hyaloraphidium curvatum]|nr:hypothetical protein DFJ74DRAFT_655589 [Hyaloraphidium curvatum]